MVAVGGIVLVLAMLFVVAPLQPCSPGVGAPDVDWCGPFRPAWLAALSPIDRLLVDNRDVLPLIWVGLSALAVLAAELVWRFAVSRPTEPRSSRRY